MYLYIYIYAYIKQYTQTQLRSTQITTSYLKNLKVCLRFAMDLVGME